MKIDLEIDTKPLEEDFQLTEKNIAFATVNAINKTVLMIQQREQQNARAKFHLRGGAGEQLILRSVAKIQPFANVRQGRAYAEIFIDQPKPRMLLTGLELGGVKTSLFGGNVAVPLTGSAARPSIADPVPSILNINALQLKPTLSGAQKAQRRSIKGADAKSTRAARKQFTQLLSHGQVLKGKQRTYQIPGVGIFQRSGPKKQDSRLIYKFKPNPPLKPMLGFTSLAVDQGDPLLQANLEAAIAAELARKR